MSDATLEKDRPCRICGEQSRLTVCTDCDQQGWRGAEIIQQIKGDVEAGWVLREIVATCLRELDEEREALRAGLRELEGIAEVRMAGDAYDAKRASAALRSVLPETEGEA